MQQQAPSSSSSAASLDDSAGAQLVPPSSTSGEEDQISIQEQLLKQTCETSERRRQQRAANAAWVLDKRSTKQLTSDVKKNSGFVKRLRTYGDLMLDQKQKMQEEADQLNMKRYVSELVQAITADLVQQAEQRNQLKFESAHGDDLDRIASLCSTFYQYYEDFADSLYPALLKATKFDAATGEAAAAESSQSNVLAGMQSSSQQSASQQDQDRFFDPAKVKIVLLLCCELFVIGVFRECSNIYILLKQFIAKEGDKRILATLNIVLQFIKMYGDIFMVMDKCRGSAEEELAPIRAQRAFKAAIKQECIVSESEKAQFRELMLRFFRSVCEKLLQMQLELERMEASLSEAQNQAQAAAEGNKQTTVREDRQPFERTRKNWYKMYQQAKLYSEYLDVDMPQNIEDSATMRLEQMQREKAEAEARAARLGRSSSVFDQYSIWDSEETRSFYEDIPDIARLVEEKKKGAKNTKNEKQPAASSQQTAAPVAVTAPPAADANDTPNGNKQADSTGNSSSDLLNSILTKSASLSTAQKTKQNHKVEQLLNKASKCNTIAAVNNWAADFILLAGKSAKKKIARALFNVNRTSLELLPFFSRLVAILTPVHRDLGEHLVNLLKEEFELLFNEKDQIKIESKIKNIKFLSELTKFQLCPREVVLDCLERCLDDFTHHNIDIACALLDSCGRYLYLSQESHQRASAALDKLWRLRQVKALDSKHDTMIQHAYYSSRPSSSSADADGSGLGEYVDEQANLPPLQRYINYILFEELNKTNVEDTIKQLRKLPWNSEPDLMLQYILDAIRNGARYYAKYSNVGFLADVIAGFSSYNNAVGIAVVDRLLEDIRCALSGEFDIPVQRRILDVKLLGELYNYQLVDSRVIFETLHTILFYCPQRDSPEDAFRVRLACTMLDTVGKYLDTSAARTRLDRFLMYMQRYIYEKQVRLPIDIEYTLADTLEHLRPGIYWPHSVKESRLRIARLELRRRKALPCFSSGRTINPDYSESSDQLQPISSLVNAEDKIWPIFLTAAASSQNGEYDDGDEEDYQGADAEDSSMVDEYYLELQKLQQEYTKQREVEAQELDKELEAMLQDSLSEKVQAQVQSGAKKITATSSLFNPATSSIANFQQRMQQRASSSAPLTRDGSEQQQQQLKFSLFVKKEDKNKADKLELHIPATERLAMHTVRAMEREQELASRTRQYEEEQQRQKEAERAAEIRRFEQQMMQNTRKQKKDYYR